MGLGKLGKGYCNLETLSGFFGCTPYCNSHITSKGISPVNIKAFSMEATILVLLKENTHEAFQDSWRCPQGSSST